MVNLKDHYKPSTATLYLFLNHGRYHSSVRALLQLSQDVALESFVFSGLTSNEMLVCMLKKSVFAIPALPQNAFPVLKQIRDYERTG